MLLMEVETGGGGWRGEAEEEGKDLFTINR